MPDEKKLVSHYELKTLLRKDGFGAVYLGQDTRDGKEYALRIIELDSPTLTRITGRARMRSQRDHPLIEQIRQRMKRISELKHSHILPVIEFGEEHIRGNNDIIFYMVSPYERESLLSYWSRRVSSNEFISLDVIADLIFQAGEALFYVHKRGLIHQYVRLSSFMFRSTARRRRSPHLLLSDFWFADITPALLEEGQMAQDLSLYLAPEQLSGRALVTSDQYTLALLAYELLLGHRLSPVDLSQGLYEHALRQRTVGISQAELEVAHRLDLVLVRALTANTAARFANIEEFVYTFRAVARGEAVELADEETSELPIVEGGGQREHDGTVMAGALGALAAGELAGEAAQAGVADEETAQLLAAARVDEQACLEHRHGLHKTVLTSRGMETADAAALDVQGRSAGEQEGAQASADAIFAAGPIADEALEQERSVIEEDTQVYRNDTTRLPVGESSAAALLGRGETFGQKGEAAGSQTEVMQEATLAVGAAGLLAGESGVAGAVVQRTSANAGGVGAGVLRSTQAVSAGGVTAVGGRRRRRLLLGAVAAVLLVALLSGGLLVFAGSRVTATVTLTLQSRTVQNIYLVTAVTTTTAGQGQVQARTLTQTVVQSKTARASGYYPGSRASGFITFYNTSTSCGCPILIPAGTPFTSNTGVTVSTDYGISVAAQCVVTVPAHALIYGPGGDIPVGSLHATFGAHVWGANRFAFAGGRSGRSNALVRQADINGLTSTLQAQNEQTAHAGLQSQLKASQRLAGMPFCRSQTAADHPVGTTATSVTVTVTTTCTVEAYDYARVVQIVQQKVLAQAASYFSNDFVEVGKLQMTVTNAPITDTRAGTLLLVVQTVGKWAYRFNQNLKRSLARVIAGKDINQVRALLSSEAGVAVVTISISGPDQSTLPSDDTKITVVLRD